jgi:cytochrome c biogenesis protein CcmG/thiol:disulfide interchange protein DsbE
MTEQRLPDEAVAHSDLPDWLDEATSDRPRAHTGQVQQRFSTLGVTAVLILVALLGVVGYALYERSKGTPTQGPAPFFAITVFDTERLDRRGEMIELDDLKDNVVVVNFWASYCIPCRDEAPVFERVWREYKDQGVVFLGINTDEPEHEALAYLDEYDVTYPNAPDSGGRMEDSYRITGIPETFIINGDGDITRHFISQVSERDLREEIDRALNG